MRNLLNKFTVAGIGEMLWDVFPNTRRMGGAPVNFSYHCSQMGVRALPVSAVGDDEDGLGLRAILADIGVDDSFVARDPDHPTGTVQVELDSQGKPDYCIVEDVAWDYIEGGSHLAQLATEVDAVCFGSLAQRNSVSRNSIHGFLENVPNDTLIIFDINLRQNYYDEDIILKSLEHCNVLKINDDELEVLAEMLGYSGDSLGRINALIDDYNLRLVAFTRGSEGSILVGRDSYDENAGIETHAVDTVGAGDSFTACLCVGLLKGFSLKKINDLASRVAAYVCTQPGATPKLPSDLVDALN